ncbi:glycosyltransferase family 2 protein [Agarilytica rhodophyticola]|uniref:glycosyltransferase family 2 protein n=1 Tax=Agarilytica rhodophyticola TaxID=1737490 RepID=UPI000B342800|nr:glycosyltransferase family 2 protein [Agarilytica rhodophyticola]
MKKKLVSIVIPTYNRSKYIVDTVNSAIGQTYDNIEVIVVDNNSEDNSWELLNEAFSDVSNVFLYRNPDNIGPVRNWQKAINFANGEYIKILWSDDLIAPDFIELFFKSISGVEKQCGFGFSAVQPIDAAGNYIDDVWYNVLEKGVHDTSSFAINSILGNGNYPVSPGCAIFKADILKNDLLLTFPNPMNIDLSKVAIGNDLLLFLFACEKYPSFSFFPEKCSYFRSHSDSISIKDGAEKLRYYYTLSKVYFLTVTTKFSSIRSVLNFKIKIDILRGKYKKFNVKHIADFYMENQDYHSYGFRDAFRFIKYLISRSLCN